MDGSKDCNSGCKREVNDMKCLIVDDEYFARKAISKMLNSKNEMDFCVLEAENGNEAIQIIQKERPDVVISDIRMPEVDGIELAEYIYINFPNISTVIISGFADFEYAQNALRYGVKEYLLKPVNKVQLLKLIDTIYSENQNKANIWKGLIEKRLKDHLESRSTIEINSFSKLLDFQEEPNGFTISVIQNKNDFTITEKDSLSYLLGDKQNGQQIYFLDNREAVVIQVLRLVNGMFDEEVLGKQLQRFRKLIYTDKVLSLSIGTSPPYYNFKDLAKAYLQAKQAMTAHLIEGRGKIYEFGGVNRYWKPSGEVFRDELRLYARALTESNERACRNIISLLTEKAVTLQDGSLSTLEELGTQLIFSINRAFKELLKTKDSKEYFEEYKSIDIKQISELEEMKQYIFNAVQSYCEIALGSNHNQEEIVSKMEKYIEEYFYEDISLEEISAKLCYMNASYLSRLFKARRGITFLTALQKIRMQKAVKFLEDNMISISEVASLVGYNDVSYFIQSFKKYYGCTPNVYKQKEHVKANVFIKKI